MENPAHVYTTGIPMSEKGNLTQNKHGCEESETLLDISIPAISDHDYPNCSNFVLSDSTSENVEYIGNSIQDGFQSEILCDFVTDVGLPSEDIRLENGLEVGSISSNNIKFPDSPGLPFPIKISSFGSIEGFVPGFDEQLENYLLPDFKNERKSDSNDVEYMEDESRNVTEAISEIAKSFGFEDLLPENFQNGTVNSASDLCENEDAIGNLTLDVIDKCTGIQSPTSTLDLADQLTKEVQSYDLNCMEMLITPATEGKTSEQSLTSNEKIPSNILPKEQSKNLYVECGVSNTPDLGSKSHKSQSELSTCENSSQSVLESDVPQVQIPEISEVSELGENFLSSNPTVLITRDKISKKMQIVLTLEQGQQIYNIDTGGVDVNEQVLGLELQNAFQNSNLNSFELQNVIDNESEQISSSIISNDNGLALEEETVFEPTSFMELIDSVPVTVKKNMKKSRSFACPIPGCGQILDKECKLKVHMFSHSGSIRPFKCTFEGCDWAFTTPYRLRRHEETHLGSKEFICNFEGCNRKFTTVYNLKTHLKRHKWPNSLVCPAKDCGLSFANRRKLELHLRIHKDVEAPYKCNRCGKQYYSANCIASHRRTHQYNEDDFKCHFQGCGKVYDKICRLKQHIRHHTGDRPYVCPAEGCNWSFMSASKLTRHMRKHTGERKFVCTEPGCGKSFMRPEHLKGHIVIHSGDKPFHCPHENCNARFTAKSSLYVHVKKHCPSVLKVVYPCPISPCVKKYNSKATLKQHLVKFHPEMMGEGKEFNIAEKLELSIPVSLVSQNADTSTKIFELDESVADDPSSHSQVQFLPPVLPSVTSNLSETSDPTVPKQTKGRSQNRNKVAVKLASDKNGFTELKRSESNSRLIKLFQKNKNGCARTDIYCTYLNEPKNCDPSPSYIFLNQNSNDTQDVKSYLSNEVKSPDVMLTSSIIFHDQSSEQFLKSNFLPDDYSNGIYHDDSLLINSSAFEAELIPVSLLPDCEESDESVLIDTSSVIFSEPNSVDTFIEPISYNGLD